MDVSAPTVTVAPAVAVPARVPAIAAIAGPAKGPAARAGPTPAEFLSTLASQASGNPLPPDGNLLPLAAAFIAPQVLPPVVSPGPPSSTAPGPYASRAPAASSARVPTVPIVQPGPPPPVALFPSAQAQPGPADGAAGEPRAPSARLPVMPPLPEADDPATLQAPRLVLPGGASPGVWVPPATTGPVMAPAITPEARRPDAAPARPYLDAGPALPLAASAQVAASPAAAAEATVPRPAPPAEALIPAPSALVPATAELGSSLADAADPGPGSPPLATGGLLPAPARETPPAASMQLAEPLGSENWSRALGERVVVMADRELTQARIALNPPQLGPIEVRVQVHGDQATVAFMAHSHLTREAIEQALPRLREMLGGHGFTQVDVNVAQHSFSERPQQAPGWSPPPPADLLAELPVRAASAPSWRTSSARLDLYA